MSLPHFAKLSLRNHAGDAVGVTLAADGESTCRLACPAGPVHVLASSSQPVIIGSSVGGGLSVLQDGVNGVSLSCAGSGGITMPDVAAITASGAIQAASLMYGSTDVETAIGAASSAASSAQSAAETASSSITALEARVAYLESQFQ